MFKCQYRSPHSGNWSECISGKFPSQSPMILVGQATGFSGAFWPATRRKVLAIWTHPRANSSYRPRETAARLDFTLTLGSFRLIRSEMPLISLRWRSGLYHSPRYAGVSALESVLFVKKIKDFIRVTLQQTWRQYKTRSLGKSRVYIALLSVRLLYCKLSIKFIGWWVRKLFIFTNLRSLWVQSLLKSLLVISKP